MTEFAIDLSEMYGPDDLHKQLEEILPLPEYYGRTLDALYDCLTEQSEGWSLRFTNTADAEATLGKYMRSFKKMCERAVKESDCLEITFE